jgi:hypothetical protein
MKRREAIQRTALALGYAISAPALAGVPVPADCGADRIAQRNDLGRSDAIRRARGQGRTRFPHAGAPLAASWGCRLPNDTDRRPGSTRDPGGLMVRSRVLCGLGQASKHRSRKNKVRQQASNTGQWHAHPPPS